MKTLRDAAGEGFSLVQGFLRNTAGTPREVAVGLAQLIYSHETSKNESQFFNAEGSPYYLDGITGRAYSISRANPRWTGWLANRYTLPGDKLTGLVHAIIDGHVRQHGPKRDVRRFSYYDTKEQVAYVTRFDGTAWKLDGKDLSVVDNGRQVMFVDDDDGVPCPLTEPDDHGLLAETLVDDLQYVPSTEGGMSAATQRALFTSWLYVIAFADRFVAKPILLVEGVAGSGKTVAVQRIQTVLLGSSFPLVVEQHGARDFPVQLLHSAPIALLDNIDSMVPWLQDAICAYTTSGGWRRRTLYANTEHTDIRPQTFIAATSRSPITFSRPDVADRCVILRLDKHQQPESTEEIFERIQELRPKLLGEWLFQVNRLVGRLREFSAPRQRHRLADFGRYVYALEANGVVENSTQALGEAATERDELVMEDNPVGEAIHAWLEEASNNGREVSTGTLYLELRGIAFERGLAFPESANGFGRRLKVLWPILERTLTCSRRVQDGYVLVKFASRPAAVQLLS